MENKVFDIVLLMALPASGKSEVRNFMANISPERLASEFHIGENLQLDDFPYVHMMRRIGVTGVLSAAFSMKTITIFSTAMSASRTLPQSCSSSGLTGQGSRRASHPVSVC